MSIDQWKSKLVTIGGCNDELKPIDRGMDHFLYVDDQRREPRAVAGGPAGAREESGLVVDAARILSDWPCSLLPLVQTPATPL